MDYRAVFSPHSFIYMTRYGEAIRERREVVGFKTATACAEASIKLERETPNQFKRFSQSSLSRWELDKTGEFIESAHGRSLRTLAYLLNWNSQEFFECVGVPIGPVAFSEDDTGFRLGSPATADGPKVKHYGSISAGLSPLRVETGARLVSIPQWIADRYKLEDVFVLSVEGDSMACDNVREDIPPIVDPDLWALAQKRKRGTPQKLGFALTGRVKCARCGLSMSARKVHRAGEPVYLYYRCNSHKELSGKCGAPLVRRDKLEAAVEFELRQTLSDAVALREIFQAEAEKERSEKTAAEVEALEAERGRVLELARRGLMSIDEAEEIISELRAKLRALSQPVVLDYPLAEYAEAAKTLSFAELLELANVTVLAESESVTLSLGGGL